MSFLDEWRQERPRNPPGMAKVAIQANDTHGSNAGQGFPEDQKKGEFGRVVATREGNSQKIATRSQRVATGEPHKTREIAEIATIATPLEGGKDKGKMRLNERRRLPGHCPGCGGDDWRQTEWGAWLCNACHPRSGERWNK